MRSHLAASVAAAAARRGCVRAARRPCFTRPSLSADPSIRTSKAFLPAELPAVVDLFDDYAGASRTLDREGLQKLLASIGERPDAETLETLFSTADADQSGAIDLDEFLAASDQLLASNPAKNILVVGGPGSGKGLLCSRLVSECGVSHVSCGDMLREEVNAGTPLGKEVADIMCAPCPRRSPLLHLRSSLRTRAR